MADAKFSAGDRVRYIGDFNPEYRGKEGEIVSVGQNTALVRFDGAFLKFHCSQERLELAK